MERKLQEDFSSSPPFDLDFISNWGGSPKNHFPSVKSCCCQKGFQKSVSQLYNMMHRVGKISRTLVLERKKN